METPWPLSCSPEMDGEGRAGVGNRRELAPKGGPGHHNVAGVLGGLGLVRMQTCSGNGPVLPQQFPRTHRHLLALPRPRLPPQT